MTDLESQIAEIVYGAGDHMLSDRIAARKILALPAIASALAGRDAVLEEAARVAEADVPADCSYGPGMGIARNIRALAAVPAPSGWRDVATDPPPESKWVLTTRQGEGRAATNICMVRRFPDGEADEWLERGSGRTTVTHGSFAPPTHWMPLPAPPQEPAHDRIVAAALQCGAVIISLPSPARHGDIFRSAEALLRKQTIRPSQQGFLTSSGRFVGREEARRIAIEAGQCPKGPAHARELYSEDLW